MKDKLYHYRFYLLNQIYSVRHTIFFNNNEHKTSNSNRETILFSSNVYLFIFKMESFGT